MAARNFKQMAAVAMLAASVTILGGAALAAPAIAASETAGIVPGPISKAHEIARNTEADTEREVRHLLVLR